MRGKHGISNYRNWEEGGGKQDKEEIYPGN
jgi:hypothetical protein